VKENLIFILFTAIGTVGAVMLHCGRRETERLKEAAMELIAGEGALNHLLPEED
jgi:hypothetical protein